MAHEENVGVASSLGPSERLSRSTGSEPPLLEVSWVIHLLAGHRYTVNRTGSGR